MERTNDRPFHPGAWAMAGFQNIVVRGLGFASVLAPALVLWGFAVLFFGLAVWRFKFEEPHHLL